ncbi:hypothetical protein, partial [Lysobacter antibioticus]|uniref:hypothetical protein n=1 Tax=Lysobacter antibioticus TaxID=84531 RepID=UPI001F24010F
EKRRASLRAALRVFDCLRQCESAHDNGKIFTATATATATAIAATATGYAASYQPGTATASRLRMNS